MKIKPPTIPFSKYTEKWLSQGSRAQFQAQLARKRQGSNPPTRCNGQECFLEKKGKESEVGLADLDYYVKTESCFGTTSKADYSGNWREAAPLSNTTGGVSAKEVKGTRWGGLDRACTCQECYSLKMIANATKMGFKVTLYWDIYYNTVYNNKKMVAN